MSDMGGKVKVEDIRVVRVEGGGRVGSVRKITSVCGKDRVEVWGKGEERYVLSCVYVGSVRGGGGGGGLW